MWRKKDDKVEDQEDKDESEDGRGEGESEEKKGRWVAENRIYSSSFEEEEEYKEGNLKKNIKEES